MMPTDHQLWAGVGRAEITDPEAGPANDPLYVKALVLSSEATSVVIVTVDAVAIEEIGPIRGDYLPRMRSRLRNEPELCAASLLISASHCHGMVRADLEEPTLRAVKEAWQSRVPVDVGVGVGHEDRISENRRLKLKSGGEADVRHAYSLPPDEAVAGVGPIDPEIGILRLDGKDGRTVAVVYNFACHPIQGVPSGANTADLVGFASRVIEENLSDGAMAFFLQGCAGDINPVWYKDVDHPRDAEPLGNLLGLSTLSALRKIECREGGELRLIRETLGLPRADLSSTIEALLEKQACLLQSLKGTSLNLKTFLSLVVKYRLSPDFPSYYSHRYLHDDALGRHELRHHDAVNRRNMDQYIENILTMEELTRVQTNLELLRKHQARNEAAAMGAVEVEVSGLRVGDFVLITFPGELSVETGLNLKKRSPYPFTFIAGYTNGYIYYTPTVEQLRNRGGAQEDCDCMLAPEWQILFEAKVEEMLSRL